MKWILFTLVVSSTMQSLVHSFVKNGTIVDPPHSMPWLVAIRIDNRRQCTGSIIGKRHVLTAAHCSHDSYGYPVTNVAVGAHDLEKLGQVGEEVGIESFKK